MEPPSPHDRHVTQAPNAAWKGVFLCHQDDLPLKESKLYWHIQKVSLITTHRKGPLPDTIWAVCLLLLSWKAGKGTLTSFVFCIAWKSQRYMSVHPSAWTQLKIHGNRNKVHIKTILNPVQLQHQVLKHCFTILLYFTLPFQQDMYCVIVLKINYTKLQFPQQWSDISNGPWKDHFYCRTPLMLPLTYLCLLLPFPKRADHFDTH